MRKNWRPLHQHRFLLSGRCESKKLPSDLKLSSPRATVNPSLHSEFQPQLPCLITILRQLRIQFGLDVRSPWLIIYYFILLLCSVNQFFTVVFVARTLLRNNSLKLSISISIYSERSSRVDSITVNNCDWQHPRKLIN